MGGVITQPQWCTAAHVPVDDCPAGTPLGYMPPSSLLNSLAIQSFATTLSNNMQQSDSAQPPISSVGSKIKSPFRNMESGEASDMIRVAPEIPPLKQSLVDQILGASSLIWGISPQPRASTNHSQPWQVGWMATWCYCMQLS